jgi:hypothetical protein
MTIFLAIWVGLLEMIQVWIVGRTGDSTPVLLTLCAGAAIGWLAPKTHVSRFDGSRAVREAERGPLRASHSRPLLTTAAARYFAVAATATAAFVIAGGIWLTLRLAGMPYNVLELFRWDARLPVLLVFALAALWVGSAASWGASVLATSERPASVLALLTVLAALVSLALLYTSVTVESIEDITGSNNLYWFVTNKDIWGQVGRELFLAIKSPALIAFFERPVRYAALYGPLFILPTLMLALARVGPEQSWKWYAATLGSSVLLLWLCKAIAFDWSSTDNLNELITRDGPWGLGGGGYLYALVALVFATALSLSARMLSPVEAVGRVALMLLATPVGWWLLNEGLEARIEKYSKIFPGTQFLLGPDRAHLLDDATLFGRWVLVQTVAFVVIATGVALANLWQRARSPNQSLPGKVPLAVARGN